MRRLARHVLFEELTPGHHPRELLGFPRRRAWAYVPLHVTLFPSPPALRAPHEHLLEADLAAALRLLHRRVGMLRDAGRAEDWLYLVREHHAGLSLAEVYAAAAARRRPLHPGTVLRLVLDAAAGVTHAHLAAGPDGARRPLVHGRLDARQVHVRFDGVADVLGHGTARLLPPSAPPDDGLVTHRAEHTRGAPPTAATDVFDLAALAFEGLVGATRAQRDPSSLELMSAAVGRRPRSRLEALRPDLPLALTGDLERALDHDPGVRFPTAVELERALRDHLARTWPDVDERAVRGEVLELFPDEEERQLARLRRMEEAAREVDDDALLPLDPPGEPEAAGPLLPSGAALSTRSGGPVTFREPVHARSAPPGRALVVSSAVGLALAAAVARACGS